ncbi:hypothetical protein I6H48_07740 [Corynebacterium amycolatum]|uniref:Uncharacterized protein n=1 Tax=Corynebacterium amycolatum TaxID=43765 RepID=A0AB37G7I1_CORAY|nr:hypothetical protein [Corynebacterium amycolatum]QPR30032.1 hypothetical protein I6G95_07165 [Corynebacterium amycolatum]QQB81871.1 hypothetical protein I6H48_07740 [Corynebacterium amycolatum]
MTILYGTFINEARERSSGSVTVSSVESRPSYEGTEIVTRELHRQRLDEGAFETPELDPGRIRVELAVSGVYEVWEIDLPLSGRVNLKDQLDAKVDYSPDVTGRVESALTKIAEAEQRIEATVADTADAIETRLQESMSAQVAAAKDAAARAEAAAQNTVVGAPETGWARNQLSDDVQSSLAKADESVSAAGVDERVSKAVEPLAQSSSVDALSKRVSVLEGVDTPDFSGYATREWVTEQVDAKAERSAVTSLQQLVENQRQQIQALQGQVAELVASESVRRIELGTGSDTSTLYIEGA